MHQFLKFILERNSTCFGQFFWPSSGVFTVHTAIYFGKKLYMFRTVPLSIIRSFILYTQQFILEGNSTCFRQFLCPSSGVLYCTHSNLFWKETLHVSDSSSVYHQVFYTVHTAIYFGRKLYMFRTVPLWIIRSFFTVHTAMVYVIQVF